MENPAFRILLFFLLIVLSVFLMTGMSAWASDSSARVFDNAGLFSADEKADLESKIAASKKTLGMDIVVLTEKSKNGKTTEAYADDFYDQGNFGVGEKKSGYLFFIDMEGRQIYFSTTGGAITLLTDDRINSILDDISSYAGDGDYAKCTAKAIAETGTLFKKSLNSGYTYDSNAGVFIKVPKKKAVTPLEAVIALLVSFFTAGGYCLNIKRTYEMKGEKKTAEGSALAYRAAAAFAFGTVADELLDKHTTTRILPTVPAGGNIESGNEPFGHSTTHTGGSGTTHGGGGRGF